MKNLSVESKRLFARLRVTDLSSHILLNVLIPDHPHVDRQVQNDRKIAIYL